MNLNLNFCKETKRREPTKQNIIELECLAHNIKAVIKAMGDYCMANDSKEHAMEAVGECLSLCNVLELLIEPIIDYMCDYAGEPPAPETTEETEA